MELTSSDIIEQPVEKVYATVRDDLISLVPYLPNIDQIEVIERQEQSPKVLQVNRWYAMAEIPGLLKKVLSPELFSWLDKAEWRNDSFEVSYEIESAVAKDLFTAKGLNTFKDRGDGTTELTVSCKVELYPENVPGVPKLLGRKVKPAIEALLRKVLEPNLTSLAQGLKGYYQQN